MARYTAAAEELGLARGGELSDADVDAVAQRVQARPAPSEEWCEVAKHRERIEGWLAGDRETRPLRLSKIHTLLVRGYELRASYDTLWRFTHDELAWREKPSTVRIDDPPPAQEAQVDFGEMGFIDDPETGRRRKLWVLVVTLAFSRYQFVWPTFRQTTEAVCEGLDRAWIFFGGIAKTLVPTTPEPRLHARKPTALATFTGAGPGLCASFRG